jgi:hypothetical protein
LVEVSKQIIEIMVSFFLIAYSVKDGKEKTWKNFYAKMSSGIDDWGNSQLVQIV